MKPYLPYNILLGITIVVCGAMVFYNLAFRESYGVTVSYEIPVSQSAVLSSREAAPLSSAASQMQSTSLRESALPEPSVANREENRLEEREHEEGTVQDAEESDLLFAEEDSWDEYEESGEKENGQTRTLTFPLNINTATVEELKYIPGVGDVTAQRIVQYRDVLEGYTSLDQLMEIKGIGQSTYEKISAYLYIKGDEWDLARGGG